ncbi:unnamed protein product [Aphanomyces euteiches]
MQSRGHPREKSLILLKANRIVRKVMLDDLSRHWLRHFFNRHPILTNRVAQTINRARNAVSQDDIDEFYTTLKNVVEEHELTGDRIFNVDETAFDSRAKNDATTIPKSNALEIASCAWKQHIVGRTVVSGFSEAGLWPVDHAKMSARLAKFKEGGLPSYFVLL